MRKVVFFILFILFILFIPATLAVARYDWLYNPYTGKQDRSLSLNQTNNTFYVTNLTVYGVVTGIVSNSSINGSGTSGYLARFNNTNSLNNSVIFESSGNIGIGTANPAQTLTVQGRVNISQNLTVNNSVLFVDGTSGNVGIGTAAPGYKLDVNGDANIAVAQKLNFGGLGFIRQNTGSSFEISAGGGNGNMIVTAFGAGGGVYLNYGGTANNDGIHIMDGATTERVTIKSGGNVGINTTSPLQTLAVQGTFNVSSNGNIALITTGGGNVGIATATPGSALHVVGNTTVTGNLTGYRLLASSDGSVTEPSIALAGMPSYGVFKESGNIQGFSMGGAIGWYYDNSGFQTQQVFTGNNRIAFSAGSGSYGNNLRATIFSTENDVVNIGARADATGFGATGTLRAGKIGIGTLPIAELHVLSSTSPDFRMDDTSVGGKNLTITQGGNLNFIEGGGIYFDVNGDTAGDALAIPTNGNVGIGMTSPDWHLVVSGSGDQVIKVNTTSGTGNSASFWLQGGATNAAWQIFTNRADLAGSADNLAFYKQLGTVGTKMVITDAGNVGINKTNPKFALDVGGKINATGIITNNATDSNCVTGEIRGNASDNKICLCTTDSNWKCAVVS